MLRFFIFLFIFSLPNLIQEKTSHNILYIMHVKSHGFCKGYCYSEITVTENQIISHKAWWQKGRRDTINFPDIRDTLQITAELWQSLIDEKELEHFFKLPSVIGCPDCDDGGAEWIEISRPGKTYRVTFESGKEIEGIRNLLIKLRELNKKEY
jgi:hypothetical protein